jgi:hypothetical protein
MEHLRVILGLVADGGGLAGLGGALLSCLVSGWDTNRERSAS